MADLAARGYSGVLHTFSENDFAYYRGTMAEIVGISHDAGLSVLASPWGLGRTFGGEAESRWVAFHPEECQVLDDGRRVAAACLNSAAYRDFCKEWADWVLECGVDSVFWDEPAWVVPVHVGVDDAARWTCRCDCCAERFGGPIPAERTPEVVRFREESVVGFLREVVAHVAERGGHNTICLLPSTEGTQGLADWDEVAAIPGLGALATDPYWKHWGEPAGPFVRRFAELRPRPDGDPRARGRRRRRARGGSRRPLDVGLRGLRTHDLAGHARRSARLGGGELCPHCSPAGGGDRGRAL
jgi:hypothetical protein